MGAVLFAEELMSLSDAARALPRRRGGRKVNVSTVYRWTTTGCRGVVLESLQIGGTRCTSRQALSRFFQRLTGPTQAIQRIHSRAEKKRAELINWRLDELGI